MRTGEAALTGVHNPDFNPMPGSPRVPRRAIQKDDGYMDVDHEEESDDGSDVDNGC